MRWMRGVGNDRGKEEEGKEYNCILIKIKFKNVAY